jgi:LacI family transcriptional regulator
MKRLTLKDVAKMAGVAPSTVSFVLNGKGKQMRIRDEVANRIMQVAEKSGYEPHRMAVNLRTGQSKTLGLIVESISGSFFASLAKTIETEAERRGYNVVYCSTENNAQKGGELIRMLGRQMVDGYLITPAPGMEKEIQQLVQQHKPIVLMDSYFPSIKTPYVLINNFDGVQQGMKHLIGKGLTKIAFVMVDVKLIQIEERLRGYVTALKEHKIPVKKKYIIQLHYHKQREDSVLCFDDHDIFRLYPPGISVIEQPIEGIAKTAIDLLMHQLDKNSGPMKKSAVELPGKFILRGSA